MQTNREALLGLARRVSACKRSSNDLDVRIEIALFKPNSVYSAIRANNAGTKVIYTDVAGNDVTCWPGDWTIEERRESTTAALKARAQKEPDHG